MDFKEIVNNRYATKKFDKSIVPEEKINELLEMVKLAPSSFGLQPFKVIVVKDSETKEKLLPASWNQPQINTCSHLLVFSADSEVIERINNYEKMLKDAGMPEDSISNYIGMMKDFANNMSEEKTISWAQKQLYIALGNALNGAKYLGFDSCPMEGFDPVQYSEILGLPKNLVPSVLCAVGYAADEPREKIRFSEEELFIHK